MVTITQGRVLLQDHTQILMYLKIDWKFKHVFETYENNIRELRKNKIVIKYNPSKRSNEQVGGREGDRELERQWADVHYTRQIESPTAY